MWALLDECKQEQQEYEVLGLVDVDDFEKTKRVGNEKIEMIKGCICLVNTETVQ